jgi:hypothetical protein
MPQIVQERPRRTILAVCGAIVVLGLGWLGGTGAAGGSPQTRRATTTALSPVTHVVTRTVTVTVVPHPRISNHHARRPRGRSRPNRRR